MSVATYLPTERSALLARYLRVRQRSVDMVAPLAPEAFRLQPMADVSPPWWNLAHTSWFFARHVLREFGGEADPLDEAYDYLLNSYYESLGPRLPREQRGSVVRPTNDEVFAYRASVDRRMTRLIETRLIESSDADYEAELASVIEIGLQHEQQHQELFFTEIKYILAQTPPLLRTPYLSHADRRPKGETRVSPVAFREYDGGLFSFGHMGREWCWDNERPVHKFYMPSFSLADRLVSCGEFLAFIADGGYRNPLLWLDNGWKQVQQFDWAAPLYWQRESDACRQWTLAGDRPIDPGEPVCHVSFYEADAFARWASETFADLRGVRLPTEREWEHAARTSTCSASQGAFLDSGLLHPQAAEPSTAGDLQQMCGSLWQWTSSYYEPYPGYEPFPGALAEYNGKFMDNQRVLRGGSCATPRDHFRIAYRNFWPAATRFQFSGLRLARSL